MTADPVATQRAASPAGARQEAPIALRGRYSHDLESIAFASGPASMVPRETDGAGLEVGDDHRDVRFSAGAAGGTTGHDTLRAALAGAIVAQRYGDAA